ncbi:MAG: hypothetical protein P0S96_04825 [Simkaniaceae bacterium]|nr:hypothetical protein [Candidatus Sacchlamyda saccharinae]
MIRFTYTLLESTYPESLLDVVDEEEDIVVIGRTGGGAIGVALKLRMHL